MKLKVEYLPIDEIKPYENNAKIHTPEQIDQIKKSIEQFGMNDPIGVWSKDNIIVEGHGRLMACQELGYTEIPIIRLDELTDDQRKAYTLAHNQLTMNTGFDLDILNQELADISIDMQEFGFDEIEEEEVEIEEDNFEINNIEDEPKAKRGDIYKLGRHVLMCGDSTEEKDVLKLMDGHIADLVVTDPPYNVDIGIEDIEEAKIRKRRLDGKVLQNDKMDNEDFKVFLDKTFYNMNKVLKEGGAFYIWFASREHVNFETALNNNGLQVRQELIWCKNTLVMGRQDYQWKHEPCLYGWKEGAGHYFIDSRRKTTIIEDQLDFDNLKKEEAIQMLKDIYNDGISTTVIHEDKPTRSDLHPTMKPLNLMARLVNNSSKKGELVLDLFGGSGSTLITCEQLDRVCYMMEYDPKYIDAIIERYETFTGNKAELISKGE